MKKSFIIIFLLLILSSCYTSPIALKYYQPVLDISMKDTLQFIVPKGIDSIWTHDDVDSIFENIIIFEKEGLNSYITEIEWNIYDYSSRLRESYKKIFLKPILIKGSSNDTLSLLFYLNGDDALRIDSEDGSQDNVAYGIVNIQIKYYDDYGLTYTSNKFYKNIKAISEN